MTHTLVSSGERISTEKILDKEFESPFALVMKKVLESKSLRKINAQERQSIINFIALQYLRTPHSLGRFQRFWAQNNPNIKFEPKNVMLPLGKAGDGFDELRDHRLLLLPGTALKAGFVLGRAGLSLYEPQAGELVLGDHPITILHGFDRPSNLIGAYEFNVPGSEVIFPFSPYLGFWLFTPLGAVSGELGNTDPGPIILRADGVPFFNRLQLNDAVKYVVAKSDDFEFAK